MLQVGAGALWPRAPQPLLQSAPTLAFGLLGLESAHPCVTGASCLIHPATHASGSCTKHASLGACQQFLYLLGPCRVSTWRENHRRCMLPSYSMVCKIMLCLVTLTSQRDACHARKHTAYSCTTYDQICSRFCNSAAATSSSDAE
jgi:hypothetical protein